MTAYPAFVSGLLFSFSLIVAIGAQNAYVLAQGARRVHVSTVVVICAASDAFLILAGVAGVGAVLSDRPGLLTGVRAAGAMLLIGYAMLAARRALIGERAAPDRSDVAGSRRAVVLTSLAFTWLNPAVYLDTLVLVGSVASSHPASRWWFGAGAVAASVSWFIGLGFGARLLTPLLRRPNASRLLDLFVSLVMIGTALRTLPM